ncbi:MAG: hypothetical protein ACK5U4_19830, partial [Rhodospirillales bacterium]
MAFDSHEFAEVLIYFSSRDPLKIHRFPMALRYLRDTRNVPPMTNQGEIVARDRQPLFTVADAARLADTSAQNVRRWLEGYSYTREGIIRTSGRKIGKDALRQSRQLFCSFLDILELRTAAALRRSGVTWEEIKAASELMRETWNADYPFAVENLKTDGRRVFAQLVERHSSLDHDASMQTTSSKLLEISKSQFAFEKVLRPALLDVVDFNSRHQPTRLWPLGKDERVFVDPSFRFGQPVVADGGVPVSALVLAVAANDNDVAQVAK